MRNPFSHLLSAVLVAAPIQAIAFEKDTIATSDGPVVITFIGHGSLMLDFKGKVIQVDPYSKLADYAKFPKADLVLLTHAHPDHLDPVALGQVRTKETVTVQAKVCEPGAGAGVTMANGDEQTLLGIRILAIPAYNIEHKRPGGGPFHPKGEGNGYVLTIGGKRILIAGDTENTPELKAETGIDVAFLPMNLPYTMTPEMVADAVKAMKPKILYPYHTGETDISQLMALLKSEKATEVRIRSLK